MPELGPAPEPAPARRTTPDVPPGPQQVNRTREAVTSALLAALLAASAWISIPVGAVPVTLQVFIVLLAGLLLGPRSAFAAVGVYLLLGAAGIPVFAGGLGGLGVLAGPTGGYLVGFLVAAPVIALVRQIRSFGSRGVVGDVVALVLGVAIVYVLGWTQLALVTGMGAGAAFLAGVVPFIGLDALKAVAALAVARALARAGLVR